MIIKKLAHKKLRKGVAIYFAVTILFEAIAPTCAYALTGGPSQPEVQSFEPVGTTEMVNPFTGDFNYNIPLMDVDGYPVNIAYHSGITMDQEASWVGLGWNINPGVINRGMRGLPDDFDGDPVTHELYMKPNRTYGLNAGVGLELFGLDKLKLGINYSIGVHYNNYNGIGIEKSLNLALSAGRSGSSPLTGGLGISSSSDEGLTLQPSLSFSTRIEKSGSHQESLGLSVGTAFNSRAGLKALSVSGDINKSVKKKKMTTNYNKGVSASFDFGMPTYTPEAALPMHNLSMTGNFKMGGAIFGIHPNFTVGGYYAAQKLATHSIVNPAYGYMNTDEGDTKDNALLDFNREEKTHTFTPNTPALPVTNFTYDIYSVSGQGVGGSYRPFRSDLGQVYDPSSKTSSDGYSIGVEFGIGNVHHFGADVSVNIVNTTTGRWENDNLAATRLTAKKKTNNPLYEKYYFKEANEKSADADPSFLASAGDFDPKSVQLNQLSKFNTIADTKYTEGGTIPNDNYRKKRERRSQYISMLTSSELKRGFGLEQRTDLYPGAQEHHIAQITTLKNDGTRYVYGIAAYNTKQEETTFAVGETVSGKSGHTNDANSGLVDYTPGTDNSGDNRMGIDNYYSNTIMPPYAHSYLLTAVLSPDYVDNDGVKGPSDGDLGNYTKFNYEKISDYHWRVPFNSNKASYNEGLKSDKKDDKANYLYGEKELWYLTSIETKNHIAVFTLGDREDGYGVADKNGGLEIASGKSKPMKRLLKISLYAKPDYNNNQAAATPIKEVHFEYDYSLCPGIPNNPSAEGKLSLKKIFFTCQNSNKGRLSPYEFTYSSFNPSYNLKGYDRWGNYKPNTATSLDALSADMPTAEYPYVELDKAKADQYSSAWTLTGIYLPSGGKIQVDYESDDYAYVQNKRAMQMFKIIDPANPASVEALNISDSKTKLYFNLQAGVTDLKEYFQGIKNLYFRFLMEITPNHFEYVSGYAQIDGYGITGNQGWVQLKEVHLNDKGTGTPVNPITKAAIQFGRLNTPKLVWSQPDIAEDATFGEEILSAMLKSNFIKNIKEAIQGPNKAIFDKGYCLNAVMQKSWIRLNNPNKCKLGGGCRVRKISISDNWSAMTGNQENTFTYGQEYSYKLQDGASSGVASYEPQLGGDENPWREPVYFDTEKLLAPDDEHYMEEPFGECFFPSPSVGYSLVTVKNLQYKNVTHNATGSIVHEFYTAKDFPTITTKTNLSAKREKNNPLSISSLLKINVKDYMTASQGFVVELNDMHGKPKGQEVYQEGQSTPISSVEYDYQSVPYLNNSFRLQNKCSVIQDNGEVQQANIGVFFDFVADSREHKTVSTSVALQNNVDGFLVPPFIPVIIPTILPAFSLEKNRFRSMVLTKVIQRFGILEKTVAKDLGSVVATENMAYDAETGAALLTKTTTDFNDSVYSLTYPAHWYYDGMGPAYRNAGFTSENVQISAGTILMPEAPHYFADGDVLELVGTSIVQGWVTEVNPNNVQVVDRAGNPVASGTYNLRVIRSGRTNQQSQPMATLATLNNPLDGVRSNVYANVLQAEALEYTNQWKTYCDCFTDDATKTTNPYVLGIKGIYKLKKHWLHLTGRTQSNYNNNTNIRKDGVFTSYSPFYALKSDGWKIEDRNWTYTSEVTEYSPSGPELENRDALGRYSAAEYGYNQTLPMAVASNSKYSEIGSDNFEDYDFSKCADNHFKFPKKAIRIDNNEAHTGRRSLVVSSGKPVSLTKQLAKCDTQACHIEFVRAGYDPVLKVYVLKVIGGVPPYSFHWKAYSNNNISVSEDGTALWLKYANGRIDFFVTDKNNCRGVLYYSVVSAPQNEKAKAK